MVANWESLRDVPDHQVIGELMRVIQQQVRDTYDLAGVSLPERQHLDIGPAQHICEQFTVSFIQMYLGTADQRANALNNCNAPRTVTLVLQVVRKAPLPLRGRQGAGTGDLPVEALDEATNVTTQDAWLLMDAATSVFGDVIGVIADVAIAPRGGDYQAAVLNLSIGVP